MRSTSDAKRSRRLNVCYFPGTNNDWGGASRIIFNIVRHIDRGRIEPLVVLTRRGPIRDELQSRNVRFVVQSFPHATGKLARLRHLAQCVRFFRANGVDLIHVAYGCLGWKPVELLAARILRIPVIQHCQAVVKAPCPYTAHSRVVLTCSNYVREHSNFGGAPSRALYDIVDVSRFSAGRDIRSELGLGESDLALTFLGRKRRRKGLDTFVELASALREDNLRFLVAGQRIGAPNADSYSDDEMAALLATDPRITYIAHRGDVENVYAASDIIVLPSRGEEPCPAVVLEAAASGKPIVATDSGAVRELIIPHKTGLIVPRGNFDALVASLRSLIENPGLRSDMARHARTLAADRYFREPIAQVEEIYAQLVM